MKPKEFLNFVKEELDKYGFKLVAKDVTYLVDKHNGKYSKYRGGFDEIKKEIVISTRSKNWVHILAHEYSHFLQFIKQTAINQMADDSYRLVFDRWINGKDLFEAEQHFLNCIAYEQQAEKYVVKIARKYDLPIGEEDSYIRSTNFYLYSWGYLYHYREWIPLFKYKTPNFIPAKHMSPKKYIEKEMIDKIFSEAHFVK